MLMSKMPHIMGILQFIHRNVCICLQCRPRPSLSKILLAMFLNFPTIFSLNIKMTLYDTVYMNMLCKL